MPRPRPRWLVRLVHEPADGDARTLATVVETAEGVLGKARGLMFRRSVPEEYALVFHHGEPRRRGLHMLFVPFPVDAVWLVDGEVTATARLRPWVGRGAARADTVLELPAGAAAAVEPGDVVRFEHEQGGEE